MSATGYTPILIYGSSTSSNTPSASNLTNSASGSELAINVADGKLFYKDSGGSVQTIASKNLVSAAPATSSGITTEQFASISAPSYVQGLMWYDSTQKALTYYNDVTNNAVTIGQETQVKVLNSTGSTIAAGAAVYATSTSSGQIYPNVALAQANALSTSAVLGLTTQSIASGAIGYVTTAGLLTPVNTGSFTVGDVLYLSPYSAGQIQNTVPPTGYPVQIGVVAYANTPNGSIYVKQTTPLSIGASTLVGQVAVANGGTGLSSLTANYIPYGNGTSAFQSSTNFKFDGTNFTVNGNSYLGGASGAQSLYVPTVSSAVNYIQASGNTTGNSPSLTAQGSDTNIPLVLQSKGTGGVYLTSNSSSTFQNGSGALQFVVGSTASAVNYLQTAAATTGNTPSLSAQGSDTNIGLIYQSKGNASQYFNTSNGTQFVVSNTVQAGTSVNYLSIQGATSTNAPLFSVQGTDTNIALQYNTKGTGIHAFRSSGVDNFRIVTNPNAANYIAVAGAITGNPAQILAIGSDTNVAITYSSQNAAGHLFYTNSAAPQFYIAPVSNAVNYFQVAGGVSGAPVNLYAVGSDTNINMTYNTKGTGAHIFYANNAAQFGIGSNPSSVNFVLSYGSATGNPVLLTANGSDTDIGVALVPKGAGLVQFGSYTAGVLTPTGYITIADSNGITRRLLVG